VRIGKEKEIKMIQRSSCDRPIAFGEDFTVIEKPNPFDMTDEHSAARSSE